MSVDLKKRFDRIVDILIQLQSKRIIKAQELASRFDVSLRTIYRDIKSLEQAGVPIIGEAGTGYSLVDGYKLPPIVFSKEEAMSFIGAEKLMEKFMDQKLNANYKSAIYKIKSVLKAHDKELVANIEQQIEMTKPSYNIFNEEVPHALQSFLESLGNKRQIRMHYTGLKDLSPQTRTIEPIGLFHENGFWYIAAFCHNRSDYRQFRADRINHIEVLDTNFFKNHISLKEYREQVLNKINLLEIRIAVGEETAPHLHWQRNSFGFVEEKRENNQIEMVFKTSGNIEHFARWFLMFADDAQVISPAHLKNLVKDILTKSLDKIKE